MKSLIKHYVIKQWDCDLCVHETHVQLYMHVNYLKPILTDVITDQCFFQFIKMYLIDASRLG